MTSAARGHPYLCCDGDMRRLASGRRAYVPPRFLPPLLLLYPGRRFRCRRRRSAAGTGRRPGRAPATRRGNDCAHPAAPRLPPPASTHALPPAFWRHGAQAAAPAAWKTCTAAMPVLISAPSSCRGRAARGRKEGRPPAAAARLSCCPCRLQAFAGGRPGRRPRRCMAASAPPPPPCRRPPGRGVDDRRTAVAGNEHTPPRRAHLHAPPAAARAQRGQHAVLYKHFCLYAAHLGDILACTAAGISLDVGGGAFRLYNQFYPSARLRSAARSAGALRALPRCAISVISAHGDARRRGALFATMPPPASAVSGIRRPYAAMYIVSSLRVRSCRAASIPCSRWPPASRAPPIACSDRPFLLVAAPLYAAASPAGRPSSARPPADSALLPRLRRGARRRARACASWPPPAVSARRAWPLLPRFLLPAVPAAGARAGGLLLLQRAAAAAAAAARAFRHGRAATAAACAEGRALAGAAAAAYRARLPQRPARLGAFFQLPRRALPARPTARAAAAFLGRRTRKKGRGAARISSLASCAPSARARQQRNRSSRLHLQKGMLLSSFKLIFFPRLRQVFLAVPAAQNHLPGAPPPPGHQRPSMCAGAFLCHFGWTRAYRAALFLLLSLRALFYFLAQHSITSISTIFHQDHPRLYRRAVFKRRAYVTTSFHLYHLS